MTVSTQTAKSQYTGNGVTVAFTGSFPILDETHVTVIVTTSGVDSTKVLNTDYTISGVGGSTFTVTFGVAPANGTRVTIARSVPLTQELDLTPNSALPSDQLEESYDKAVMIDQQINETVSRALRQPLTDSVAIADIPTSTARAGLFLKFDSNGDPEAADIAALGNIAVPVPIASGGTGQTTASGAFDALKQSATDAATGVVELATQAEVSTGTDAARVVTAATLAGREPTTVTVDTANDKLFIRDATDGLEKLVAANTIGGLAAATQSDMETATSTTVASTPGRQHHHPGHPKAWVNFNGTGTIAIRADYGVASLTDHGGSGEYSITFDTAFSSANYCAIGICDRTINTTHATEGIQTVTFGTGAFRFICVNTVPTAVDQEYIGMAFWGDQ